MAAGVPSTTWCGFLFLLQNSILRSGIAYCVLLRPKISFLPPLSPITPKKVRTEPFPPKAPFFRRENSQWAERDRPRLFLFPLKGERRP